MIDCGGSPDSQGRSGVPRGAKDKRVRTKFISWLSLAICFVYSAEPAFGIHPEQALSGNQHPLHESCDLEMVTLPVGVMPKRLLYQRAKTVNIALLGSHSRFLLL